jgi:hypothetical protein
MPDMSEFESAKPRAYRRMADTIDHWEKTDPERHAALLAALDDASYSNNTIAKVLRSWGTPMSESAIYKWRRDGRV